MYGKCDVRVFRGDTELLRHGSKDNSADEKFSWDDPSETADAMVFRNIVCAHFTTLREPISSLYCTPE